MQVDFKCFQGCQGVKGECFSDFLTLWGEGGLRDFGEIKKPEYMSMEEHSLACTRCLKVQRRSYFNITPRELKTYIQQLNDE